MGGLAELLMPTAHPVGQSSKSRVSNTEEVTASPSRVSIYSARGGLFPLQVPLCPLLSCHDWAMHHWEVLGLLPPSPRCLHEGHSHLRPAPRRSRGSPPRTGGQILPHTGGLQRGAAQGPGAVGLRPPRSSQPGWGQPQGEIT